MIKISKNKSILQKDMTKCYVCSTRQNLHVHHVFEGRNRKNSDEDFCVVALCQKHHNGSKQGVHFDPVLDKIIKERMEKAWLEVYNKEVKDFIARYRKNYLT